MRKTIFLIIKFLPRFLNKLMIKYTQRYTTMLRYLKVLFCLKTCVNQKNIYAYKKTKAFKIKQSKLKNQADSANYSTERTYMRGFIYEMNEQPKIGHTVVSTQNFEFINMDVSGGYDQISHQV